MALSKWSTTCAKRLSTRFVRTWRDKYVAGEHVWLRRSRFVAREHAWADQRSDLFSPASSSIASRIFANTFHEKVSRWPYRCYWRCWRFSHRQTARGHTCDSMWFSWYFLKKIIWVYKSMKIGLQFCFTTVRHVGHSCSPLTLVLLGWVFWFVAFFLGEQLLISFWLI